MNPPTATADKVSHPTSTKSTFDIQGTTTIVTSFWFFQGLDGPNEGVDHEAARIACGILANNNWAGFFAEDKEGKQNAGPSDAILHKKNYYFHVSSDANGKQRSDTGYNISS